MEKQGPWRRGLGKRDESEKAWFQAARPDLAVVAEELVWWGRPSGKWAANRG